MRACAPAPRRTTRAARPGASPSRPLGGPAASLLLALVLNAGGLLGGGVASAARAPVSLRVVGGTSVPAITSFPFQVALFTQSPSSLLGQQSTLAFCGGVIIDATQVLTAAHCVSNELTGAPVAPASVTVFAGSATLPTSVPAQPVASSVALDPQYNPQTADYDVAVVTLATPLYAGSPRADGSAGVAPIALITPALADRFANPNLSPPEPVVISGWGQTSPVAIGAKDMSGNLPQQLQAAQTHLISDAACSSQYRGLGGLGGVGFPDITPRMLCAGEPGGGIDACAGDSGGPLVVDIDNPASPPADYVLAGLIDFGAGCAQPGYPGVYVRLATPAIASFITQQALASGQQLIPPPPSTGVAPPRRAIAAGGTARLAARGGKVKGRVARVAIGCTAAACTGTLTLRTTITVGIAHFAIAPGATAKVRVRITPRGRRELDRHRHRLRTHATLRTSGSILTHQAFTLSD